MTKDLAIVDSCHRRCFGVNIVIECSYVPIICLFFYNFITDMVIERGFCVGLSFLISIFSSPFGVLDQDINGF